MILLARFRIEHLDVHQYHVRPQLARQLDRFRTVKSNPYDVVPPARQLTGNEFADHQFVIDDQHANGLIHHRHPILPDPPYAGQSRPA